MNLKNFPECISVSLCVIRLLLTVIKSSFSGSRAGASEQMQILQQHWLASKSGNQMPSCYSS